MTTAASSSVIAQSEIQPKPEALKANWGDQGDGTFVNPILPSDYSDLDCIRVGDDYYAITSSFQYSPGVAVLKSKDLVTWDIIGHAVTDVTVMSPELNWDKMNRYGKGVWAGAIRHHDGKFWIYFGTPDEGFFMTTATDPAGPWEPLHALWRVSGWNDCCPFWDDDGQGYFICTNFSDKYAIHLFKLSKDGKSLEPGYDKIVYQARGSEASKLYKINGLYYHYFSEVTSEGRVVKMRRSKSLEGPWETKQLNHVNSRLDKSPNQGGMVQAPSGDWWFITHQGTGDWEGRAMVLLPIEWVDGWPILGKRGADGIGNMVWTANKPIPGPVVEIPPIKEEFDDEKLSLSLEWNYQPRVEKISLTERPGFLRLHAFKPLKNNDLLKAGNTLTQRCMRTSDNEVILKLDISGMADGQEAGLCHYAGVYSALSISQSGDVRTITYNERGKITPGPELKATTVWLKSTWGIDGESTYSYSTDGTTYTPFGNKWKLTWGNYRGDRIGVFSYNNKSDAGYVDVDSFHYTFGKRKP